jgi:signal transduction histidine kinase
MNSASSSIGQFRAGAFHQRIAWVFALQFVAVVIVCVMGIYNVAPWFAVIAVIVIVSVLAWMSTRREWRTITLLAKLVNGWDEHPDLDALRPERLARNTDADLASLARGLHGFASRIAVFNQRERNFTRDASHELRSPLTVIKMSVDMLSEETEISEFGARSVQRIKRASMEMEALVEALLILARETDMGAEVERFVVNEVLARELEAARGLLAGRPIELQLEEPAQFALVGSSRAFSVLCWQVIRNACQQTEFGRVVVTVLPGVVSVSNHIAPQIADESSSQLRSHGVDRHGFELAIAQRISDRFAWPLELTTHPGRENIARIRFPNPLPVDV